MVRTKDSDGALLLVFMSIKCHGHQVTRSEPFAETFYNGTFSLPTRHYRPIFGFSLGYSSMDKLIAQGAMKHGYKLWCQDRKVRLLD